MKRYWNSTVVEISGVRTIAGGGTNASTPTNALYNLGVPVLLQENLLSYWNLNQSSGPRVDSYINNYSLIDINNNVLSGSGIINVGARFTGSNTQTLQSEKVFNLSDSFTLSFWVNYPKFIFPGSRTVTISNGNDDWGIVQDDTEEGLNIFNQYGIGDAVFLRLLSGAELSTGIWNHVTITKNKDYWEYYKNGNLVTGKIFQKTLESFYWPTGNVFLTIGQNRTNFTSDGPPSGVIDEVGLWGRALNGLEIRSLYNNGSGLSYDKFGVDINLVNTTKNQTISGEKTFTDTVILSGSGVNHRAIRVQNLQRDQFIDLGVGGSAADFGTRVFISSGNTNVTSIYRAGAIPTLFGYGIVFGGGAFTNKKGYLTVGGSLNPTGLQFASLVWTDRILSGNWASSSPIRVGNAISVMTTGNQIISGQKTFVNNTDFQQNISVTGFYNFDITNTGEPLDGQMNWHSDYGTVQIGMNGGDVINPVGFKSFYRVKAAETIRKGRVVMALGGVGNSEYILGREAQNIGTSGQLIMGVSAEEILANNYGDVVAFGAVRGVNTSSYPQDSILYYDSLSTGGFTNIPPQIPNAKVIVGLNTTSSNNGIIFVRVTAGSELGGSDSNVKFSNLQNNDIIRYSNSGYWYNSPTSGNIVTSNDTITRMIKLTQAQYNALSPKDPTTFYVIVG